METSAINKMCDWERKKAIYLMNVAENYLNIDLSEYGLIGVNSNSGNVYLWVESYPFCLYLPINCELTINDIYVSYTNFFNGEESEESLSNFKDTDEIIDWCDKIEREFKYKE